jgi:N-acetyl sugar amidotransferase
MVGVQMKKLTGKYGLPLKVQFCKKCTMNNQRPSSTVEFKQKSDEQKRTLAFGEDGICEACRYAEQKKFIDWKDRHKELEELCNRFRRNDGRYDVVVPGSGGKDSVQAAHILKYKYNMNPLTVTWAPHVYTTYGWNNFNNWIKVGGLDNILFTPNGKVHSFLTSLSFKNLLHPFQPFIIGQKIIGPKIASKFGIPLVMYGENQAEYGNKIDENKKPTMDQIFFSTNNILEMKFGGVSVKEIIISYDFKKEENKV